MADSQKHTIQADLQPEDFPVLFFDLYGTLIDIRTDEHAAQTWKKWLRCLDACRLLHPSYIQCRRDFFELDRSYREQAAQQGRFEVPEIDVLPIYKRMLLSYGNKEELLTDALLSQISYAFRCASRQRMELYPGVTEFLLRMRTLGKKLYIVSNAQASYTQPEICYFHLDELTDDRILSSDYSCMKPDPAFFQVMLNRYLLDPNQVLMLGDSEQNDVIGAQKAGIRAIHLAGKNHPNSFYLAHSKP